LIKLRNLLEWNDLVVDPGESLCCDRSLNADDFINITGWRAPARDAMLEGIAAEWPEDQKTMLSMIILRIH
jgi:hypothetical protein